MKPELRIRGLVRLSRQVREALDRGDSFDPWREPTGRALEVVARALREHGLVPADLPAPTRRAYRYLLDLEAGAARPVRRAGIAESRPGPRPAPHPDGPAANRRALRLDGVQRELDQVLVALDLAIAGQGQAEPLSQLGPRIRYYSGTIEQAIAARRADAAQWSERTRAARAWFAFFASAQHLADYARASRAARASLVAEARVRGLRLGRVAVQFRPQGGVYRFYRRHQGVELRLPTEMVALDTDAFAALARQVLGSGRGRETLYRAVAAPACRAVQAELASLAGLDERHRGRVHDLAASFERVSRRFFDAAIDRPRLCWSGRLTHRKLGHYDPLRDTLMVSSTLDSAEVPLAALDFVMFHELLHKRHGTDWSGGQARVHTAAFRRDERRYPDKDAVEALLGRVCARRRRAR